MNADKPTVFISCSHKDEKWKDRLVQQLRVLGGARGFDVWDDQRIAAGDTWKADIERALLSAHVAVLLVSVDFLDAGFIHSVEVPRLRQRREQEKLPVVPVIVRPCPWKRIPWLAEMQVRPKQGEPLSAGKRHEFEAELARLAEQVDALIEQRKTRAAEAVVAPEPAARVDSPTVPIVALPTVPVIIAPPAPAIVAPPGVTLRAFGFETVTLDERGQVRVSFSRVRDASTRAPQLGLRCPRALGARMKWTPEGAHTKRRRAGGSVRARTSSARRARAGGREFAAHTARARSHAREAARGPAASPASRRQIGFDTRRAAG